VSNVLYGTTVQGGITNRDQGLESFGTVFAVNTDGTGFAPVYRFSATSGTNRYNADGAQPLAGLIVVNNTLYGTAGAGGSSGEGTIFSLPVTLRSLFPAPPQGAPIYADFTAPAILTSNMSITPTAYFTYNTNSPGNWDIAAVSFGFNGTFQVPSSGTYRLTVQHQTSPVASCPGGGYSPVNIYINGNPVASDFDPAQHAGGSLSEVTNSWLIEAAAGVNTLAWAAGPLCSRYWIQGIQITPSPPLVLGLSLASNNVVLSWDTNLTGFVLESSASLGGAWSQVLPAPAVVGNMNFSTNSMTSPAQFYRLRDATGQ
jgi:uncharacterized repeat protein (TIGR03803 family)